MALACLVAGDRRHHLAAEIRPGLAAGQIIICDRYLPSSLVLQRMDGISWDVIGQLNQGADQPALAVILNGIPAVIRPGWPKWAGRCAPSTSPPAARRRPP